MDETAVTPGTPREIEEAAESGGLAATPMSRTRDGMSLWRQIARTLEAAIESAEYQPGQRLPTEAQLAARFAVNRHTVRRALEQLSSNGLIRVEQGRGTFVAEDIIDYTIGSRTRFHERVRRQNREPSGRTLRTIEDLADRYVANALGVDLNSPVILHERLGFADDIAICFSTHFFAIARCPGIAEALRAQTSITAALQESGVSDHFRHSTRVTARLPMPSEMALLGTTRNRPLIICENVNVDAEGQVIEYNISRWPTSRVQIVFEPQDESRRGG